MSAPRRSPAGVPPAQASTTRCASDSPPSSRPPLSPSRRRTRRRPTSAGRARSSSASMERRQPRRWPCGWAGRSSGWMRPWSCSTAAWTRVGSASKPTSRDNSMSDDRAYLRSRPQQLSWNLLTRVDDAACLHGLAHLVRGNPARSGWAGLIRSSSSARRSSPVTIEVAEPAERVEGGLRRCQPPVRLSKGTQARGHFHQLRTPARRGAGALSPRRPPEFPERAGPRAGIGLWPCTSDSSSAPMVSIIVS